MNFKFPNKREFKNRKCFNCKKIIDFGEFYIRNKKIKEERLIKLWEREYLEFYCCLCYDKIMNENMLQELNDSLNEKHKDILKILESKFSKKIPLITKIEYNRVGIIIEKGNIIGMGLYKCLKKFPEEINHFETLQILNLSWNSLEKLPKSIKNLKNLKELELVGNKLSSLPEEIGHLKCLEEFDLSVNDLQYIPESIANLPSLKTLNLIHNKILKIPDFIQTLENKGLKVLI
jgi:Leucine-rich repeat (LRR) protein